MLSAENWQVFWGVFSAAMLVFSVIFYLMFHDKVDKEDAAPAELSAVVGQYGPDLYLATRRQWQVLSNGRHACFTISSSRAP